MRVDRRRFLATAVASTWAAQAELARANAARSPADELLSLVRSFADAMLEHGRDRYGANQGPMFAATLDLKTLAIPSRDDKRVQTLYQIFRNEPHYATATNPQWDQNLFRILYALTALTGEAKYARAADDAVVYFFDHCQSPVTGLLAWGEHVGWDIVDDKLAYGKWKGQDVDIHEFSRPWGFWEKTFALAPEPCRRFARGLWEHQIADQRTGRYSRHAHYFKHGPGTGFEFPRHGGFYIATWAAVHERTGEAELVRAVETLVRAFEGWRNPKTGILPADTSHPTLCWPQSNLSLAIDLWTSAGKMPKPLGERMRSLALQIDETFLRMPHELDSNGRGFGQSVNAETNVIEVIQGKEPGRASMVYPGGRYWPYTVRWATGYGGASLSDAKTAMMCLERHRQTGNARYRQLALATADRYLTDEPEIGNVADPETKKPRFVHLTPEMMAAPIAILLASYRQSSRPAYLSRAEHFAGYARQKLFAPGAAIPRSSHQPELNCHVACSLADSLMLEYLDLWLAKTGRPNPVDMSFLDR